jgi:cytochrome d ubiquinol oxidase subunit II
MDALQTIWFLLVGILIAGYAVLDGFDLGVGMLHLFIAKDDRERRILLNSIGPLWDGNEVWLLTGGGAIFAAFPRVYATVFSGFYLPLMLLLAALIVRATAVEFRSKEESPRWRSAWDVGFAIGSFLPALLFGVAIGNIVRGVPLAPDGEFSGSFLGLLNPFAIAVGLLSTAMFVMQGASWLSLKTEGDLRERAIRAGRGAWMAFVALWIIVTAAASTSLPHLWGNYHAPLAWIAPLLFVAAAAWFPLALRTPSRFPFAASSLAIIALIAILGQALYPNMVPAFGDLAQSLTIRNASSTMATLKVMLTIAVVGMPFVIAYTVFIYRRFAGPVRLDEESY